MHDSPPDLPQDLMRPMLHLPANAECIWLYGPCLLVTASLAGLSNLKQRNQVCKLAHPCHAPYILCACCHVCPPPCGPPPCPCDRSTAGGRMCRSSRTQAPPRSQNRPYCSPGRSRSRTPASATWLSTNYARLQLLGVSCRRSWLTCDGARFNRKFPV